MHGRPVEPIRVLVVDDNAALCSAMAGWLSREPGFAPVVCQPDWRLAEDQIRVERPDIVLLDVDLPGVSGIDLIGAFTAVHPGIRIVMLSGHVRRDLVERAIDGGAAGYLVKDLGGAQLLSYIRRVAQGEVALCPAAISALAGG